MARPSGAAIVPEKVRTILWRGDVDPPDRPALPERAEIQPGGAPGRIERGDRRGLAGARVDMDDPVPGLADLGDPARSCARVAGDHGNPDGPGARVDREIAQLVMRVEMERDGADDPARRLADRMHPAGEAVGDPDQSPARVHANAARLPDTPDAVHHPVLGLADFDDGAGGGTR